MKIKKKIKLKPMSMEFFWGHQEMFKTRKQNANNVIGETMKTRNSVLDYT